MFSSFRLTLRKVKKKKTTFGDNLLAIDLEVLIYARKVFADFFLKIILKFRDLKES